MGRKPGIHLSPSGEKEAWGLAERLASIRIGAVLSSPLERAMETALPIAIRAGVSVQPAEEFNEVDYGEWTGRTFDMLAMDARWRRFNHDRRKAYIPGGESIKGVQERVLSKLAELSLQHERGNIAVVTHAEPIRLAMARYVADAGCPHYRPEISIASLTIIRLCLPVQVLAISHTANVLPELDWDL